MHGDLSGGNILLTSCTANPHGFSAKVSDFGLARDLDVLSKIETKTTGTVTHMAPEVLPGRACGPWQLRDWEAVSVRPGRAPQDRDVDH